MSKKRDPVVAVLKYFQEAELPLAQQALSLCTAIVKSRVPALRSRPRAVAKTPLVATVGQAE